MNTKNYIIKCNFLGDSGVGDTAGVDSGGGGGDGGD